MYKQGIQIESTPQLKRPVLIIGFDGWGNALNVAKGMISYLIQKLGATKIATINPDRYYRYDAVRPWVTIEQGVAKELLPPGGNFFAAQTSHGERDIVILDAYEPNMNWFQFSEELISFCTRLEIDTIISLGGMFDNVLHTDRIISGTVSSETLLSRLIGFNINTITYQGPTSIHSVILSEGQKKGMSCYSLWCHCPYYLQDMVFFGMISHLGKLISSIGEFQLDTEELDKKWRKTGGSIQQMLKNKPEIMSAVSQLKKQKPRGAWTKMKPPPAKDEKVINLQDYMDSE